MQLYKRFITVRVLSQTVNARADDIIYDGSILLKWIDKRATLRVAFERWNRAVDWQTLDETLYVVRSQR